MRIPQIRILVYIGASFLFVAPWFFATFFLPNGNLNLTCQSAYEIVRDAGNDKEVRSYGTMTSYYHADGSGIARYTGTLDMGTGSGQSNHFAVYRTSQFTYELIGSFVRITSQTTAKHLGDNVDDAMAIAYVYPGFKNKNVDYFQILKIEEGSYAAGSGSMPRMYCETLPQ